MKKLRSCSDKLFPVGMKNSTNTANGAEGHLTQRYLKNYHLISNKKYITIYQIFNFIKNNHMKTILIIIFSFICILSSGQNNIKYFIFTPQRDTAGIRHLSSSGQYDNEQFRCDNHYFKIVNSKVGIYCTLWYSNQIGKPDNPILIKPIAFLDSVEYIDWDIYTKGFTLQEYRELIQMLDTYDKVYFIDRAEIKNGMMKMYPVKEMKSLF